MIVLNLLLLFFSSHLCLASGSVQGNDAKHYTHFNQDDQEKFLRNIDDTVNEVYKCRSTEPSLSFLPTYELALYRLSQTLININEILVHQKCISESTCVGLTPFTDILRDKFYVLMSDFELSEPNRLFGNSNLGFQNMEKAEQVYNSAKEVLNSVLGEEAQ